MKITRFAFVLIILITWAWLVIPAQAGKPKPPDPYPAPLPPVQTDAYPAPGQGLPAPQLPNDFCVIYGQLCAWGYWGQWVATVRGIGIQPDLQVITCIGQIARVYRDCREMRWVQYNASRDENVWVTPPAKGECLEFPGDTPFYTIYVYSPDLGYGEIRQPNEYYITCKYIPNIRKG